MFKRGNRHTVLGKEKERKCFSEQMTEWDNERDRYRKSVRESERVRENLSTKKIERPRRAMTD